MDALLSTAGIFVGFAFIFLSIILAYVAIKLFNSDSSQYRRLNEINNSWTTALKGAVNTYTDGHRNYLVNAGTVYSRKEDKWLERGAISEEALDSLLKN